MPLRVLLLSLLVLLGACGTVNNSVTVPIEERALPKQFVLAPVTVSSREADDNSRQYNGKLQALAQQEISDAVRARGGRWLPATARAPTVTLTVDAIYGDRALRLIPYLLRAGAGSGLIRVDIQLRSVDGHVLYATHSEGSLKRGFLGGDILDVGERTIRAAVADFCNRL